jgi:hypothetical protein
VPRVRVRPLAPRARAVTDVASLFQSTEQPKARKSDPGTSRSAAARAFPRQGTQKARIVIALAHAGRPLTAEEISIVTGEKYVSVSTRVTECVRAGWLRVAGEKDNKQTLALTDVARERLSEIERRTGVAA